MKFFVFLVFRFLPKPRYQFWLPQRGGDYALFHYKCKALALQWVKEQLMVLDDEYRARVCFEKKPSAIELINRRYWRELPITKPKDGQQTASIFWLRTAATMAGDTTGATPGEVFGRLHDQTAEGLKTYFDQATEALNKEGL